MVTGSCQHGATVLDEALVDRYGRVDRSHGRLAEDRLYPAEQETGSLEIIAGNHMTEGSRVVAVQGQRVVVVRACRADGEVLDGVADMLTMERDPEHNPK